MKKILSIALIFIFCLSIPTLVTSVKADTAVGKTIKKEFQKPSQTGFEVQKNSTIDLGVLCFMNENKSFEVNTDTKLSKQEEIKNFEITVYKPERKLKFYPNKVFDGYKDFQPDHPDEES